MKKTIISALVMLLMGVNLTFAQDNQEVKHESVQYYFFVNNIPSEFNYPLIGLVNNVNGNHASIQIGLINSTSGNFGGWQEGLINSVGGNVIGLQDGFINSVGGNLTGVQNGFINSVGGTVKGIQTGFINADNGDLMGIQSGFINSVGQSLYGIQCGFINSASQIAGIQGGFINSAEGICGLQHGFVNSTKNLCGLQLGFINSVDHIEKGLPIGFLSFVKQGGYKAIEVSYTTTHPINVAFKTGIRQFYTFPMISWTPDAADKLWVGYGAGSNLDLTKKLFFNPELLSQHNISRDFNHYLSLKANAGFRLSDRFEIVAGPVLAWNVVIDAEDFHQNYTEWNPGIISVNKLSLGFNAAVRFCF
ncbi:MAG: hypothetical protein QM800_05645 [Paludibacter sp.]